MANTQTSSNFGWSSAADEDLARSFSSLIKYNDGFFKSQAQATFVVNPFKPQYHDRRKDYENIKNFFGVDMEEGQVAILISGWMSWANYGTNGNRPVTWVYVLDNLGVVAKYKLKYQGTCRSGTGPVPEETKKEWERMSDETPDWATPEAAAQRAEVAKQKADALAAIDFLGQKDEIITNLNVTLTAIIDRGEGQWGWQLTSVFKTDDGKVIYWNSVPKFSPTDEYSYGKVGDKYTIKRVRIKDTFVNKSGVKAVSITRPTFQK